MDDDFELKDTLIQASLAEQKKTSLWEAYIQLKDIQETLGEDFLMIGRAEKDDANLQFWRRAAVRALFALLEGVTYRMKRLAYEAHLYERKPLSASETSLILEESYELNDKGEAVSRQNYPRLERNVKFAFAILARAYDVEYKPHFGDESGWGSFLKTLKVRNRITHPKWTQDLIISDVERDAMVNTFLWFLTTTKGLTDRIGATLTARAEELEKAATGR